VNGMFNALVWSFDFDLRDMSTTKQENKIDDQHGPHQKVQRTNNDLQNIHIKLKIE
jgi:hypothetical protein